MALTPIATQAMTIAIVTQSGVAGGGSVAILISPNTTGARRLSLSRQHVGNGLAMAISNIVRGRMPPNWLNIVCRL